MNEPAKQRIIRTYIHPSFYVLHTSACFFLYRVLEELRSVPAHTESSQQQQIGDYGNVCRGASDSCCCCSSEWDPSDTVVPPVFVSWLNPSSGFPCSRSCVLINGNRQNRLIIICSQHGFAWFHFVVMNISAIGWCEPKNYVMQCLLTRLNNVDPLIPPYKYPYTSTQKWFKV